MFRCFAPTVDAGYPGNGIGTARRPQKLRRAIFLSFNLTLAKKGPPEKIKNKIEKLQHASNGQAKND